MYILAGDIGGTKTLLQVTSADGSELLRRSYPSAAYAGLDEIIAEFMHESPVRNIDAACLALAGPVAGRRVQLTNLPWEVDADAIAARFAIAYVTLINDFTAVGMGIDALPPADLLTLQGGLPQPRGNRLVVGAGTGLGVGWLTPAHGRYTVHPSEGGHMDFAAQDELQAALLRYLQERYGHVSYERVVSGHGLVSIHDFLRDSGRAQPSAALLAAMSDGDAAAAVAEFAQRGGEAIASMAFELFMTVYGAFAGNLALASLPRGGVYVAGGIAARIAAALQQGPFMRAFLDKGRFSMLLREIPVYIVLNAQVGLLGAAAHARTEIERLRGAEEYGE